MGFASKLEDETERRDGEGPRPISRRLAYVFDVYGVANNLSEQQPELLFDEASEKELSEILQRLEQAHQRKVKAFAKEGLLDGKRIGNALSTHEKLADNIDVLIKFLVPYVRQMQGERRRSWNRTVEQLKKARYL
jgi:hypothetical protein